MGQTLTFSRSQKKEEEKDENQHKMSSYIYGFNDYNSKRINNTKKPSKNIYFISWIYRRLL